MTEKNYIKIQGAKTHNLKNISVKVPKNKLTAVTGVSGSGKSSFAFDTLYSEGQRRYIESFSPYVKQFLTKMDKAPVEKIEGLPPAISVSQQTSGKNPRSTVGTITGIYNWFRVLFSKIGKPHCPICNKPLYKHTINQIVKEITKFSGKAEIVILAPIFSKKEEQSFKDVRKLLNKMKQQGFIRVRIDKKIYKIENAISKLNGQIPNKIEVIIDRFIFFKKNPGRARIIDSVETALKIGNGVVIIRTSYNKKAKDLVFTNKPTCPKCNKRFSDIEPRLFSFNSPYGACSKCDGLGIKLEIDPDLLVSNTKLTLAEGAIRIWPSSSYKPDKKNKNWQELKNLSKKYGFSLNKPVNKFTKEQLNMILYGKDNFKGVISILEQKHKETNSDYVRNDIEKYMKKKTCQYCQGKRLSPEALAVTVNGKSIYGLTNLSIENCKKFFEKIYTGKLLSKKELEIAKPIISEIIKQLQLLIEVNLEYLSLSRSSLSISVGETQRIKIATQINSKLTGILYVLDEPSIGLHPRDQKRLLNALFGLRNMGNTLLVVEHDNQTINTADWIIDIGPEAGEKGGEITFNGLPSQIKKSNTLTGKYLSGCLKVDINHLKTKEKDNKKILTIFRAKEHNLKNIDVKIPLEKFVCITGVSGSGKSTLMNDILAKALTKKFYNSNQSPGTHEKISGLNYLDKSIIVDQAPIGRTPRSNIATYTGIFDQIRNLFANTKQAKARGYKSGHFSFNVRGGRCEECQGAGFKKLEMYYLPDRYIKCPACEGKRYNEDILEIKYRGVDIYEVLEMTVEEALKFFKDVPAISYKLSILKKVGLDYIKLGQPAPSLSGGEAQRIKLSSELSKKDTGKTIYILDEPTTGLHPDDIKKLLTVLIKLTEKGNTVLVIEHDLDVIKNADWIIDLGPEGGDGGGSIVAEGSPKQIIKNKNSYTAKWLKKQINL